MVRPTGSARCSVSHCNRTPVTVHSWLLKLKDKLLLTVAVMELEKLTALPVSRRRATGSVAAGPVMPLVLKLKA